MQEELEQVIVKPVVNEPHIDFSFQLNLARDKAEKKIFSYLCEISQDLHKAKKKIGALIVFGMFGTYESPSVSGMRKLSTDKLDKYLNVNFSQFKEEVIKILSSGEDGAIVINQDGQILADKIYLTVDEPNVEIPVGSGTRHISAASFSTRPDILATFTLSEESLVVRTWKDGAYTEQFHPEQKEEE